MCPSDVIEFPKSRIVRRRGVIGARQRKCLAFIAAYRSDHAGEYPKFDLIAAHLGLKSAWGAVRIVNQLWQAGLVERPGETK
jgi:hypothetical protein